MTKLTHLSDQPGPWSPFHVRYSLTHTMDTDGRRASPDDVAASFTASVEFRKMLALSHSSGTSPSWAVVVRD